MTNDEAKEVIKMLVVECPTTKTVFSRSFYLRDEYCEEWCVFWTWVVDEKEMCLGSAWLSQGLLPIEYFGDKVGLDVLKSCMLSVSSNLKGDEVK